ncbi:cyanide insensitive terminal oxidase, subunit III [Pseudomonas citronellolis]|nr:cyanide insensitive terminal oxidase, subunit III [Pseudomonas citronellolis]KRW75464.1 cyanide insensitive terminal oxidase, subunit III [Pseudomonas citronellolis]
MATTEGRAMKPQTVKAPLYKRLGWLVLIWAGSVAALGVAAWLMRLLMNAAGLGTPH